MTNADSDSDSEESDKSGPDDVISEDDGYDRNGEDDEDDSGAGGLEYVSDTQEQMDQSLAMEAKKYIGGGAGNKTAKFRLYS